jgi:hypothetical protein
LFNFTQTQIHQHFINVVVFVVIAVVTGAAPTALRTHQENHP